MRAVVLYGTIPQHMSPRVFQRKSLRGQTKYLMQFFFCLSSLAHIVFILYEQKQVDNFPYIFGLHRAERFSLKRFACLNEQSRLFLFETEIRLKHFESFSHLRETVDAQFRHTIVPFRNVAALEPRSNPRERSIMASVLIKTDRSHKAHPFGRISALL